MVIKEDTIKCSRCGWDTKIGGIIHLYIPAPGVKCPNCNILIISVPDNSYKPNGNLWNYKL